MIHIHILFSTFQYTQALRLLRSIELTLETEQKKDFVVSAYVFDKTPEQDFGARINEQGISVDCTVVSLAELSQLEHSMASWFGRANCSLNLESIQRARIQQQVYIIREFNRFRNGIVWQLDDDMVFGHGFLEGNSFKIVCKPYFSSLVSAYIDNKYRIDAIVGASTFVPPIPPLLYTRTQLTDVVNRGEALAPSARIGEYHDFYNSNTSEEGSRVDFYPELNALEKVALVLKGVPVTRYSILAENDAAFSVPTKNLRGGNFIVFNPEIYRQVEHLGFQIEGLEALRRTDMIHCHLLSDLGYRIVDSSHWSLVHQPELTNSDFRSHIDKYEKDMWGCLLVNFLFRPEKFTQRLQFYQTHSESISSILRRLGFEGGFHDELLLLDDLSRRIQNIDVSEIIGKFELAKEVYTAIKQASTCRLQL